MIPFGSVILAEVTVEVPKFTISEVGVLFGIGGSILAVVVYLFSTKFVTREAFETHQKEISTQISACNQTLALNAQTNRELIEAINAMSLNVQANTSVTIELDKRLSILEVVTKSTK